MRTLVAFAVCSLVIANSANAEDWPQWMGADRDGVWHETGIIDSFAAGKADIDWEASCGLGYAGPAYAGDSVYLFDYEIANGTVKNNPGQRGELKGAERLRRINAVTGETVWTGEYPATYSVSYPSGPRATPTVTDDHVYTLGAMGHLTCFDRRTGDQVWQVDIPTTFGASVPIWGYASHPLFVPGNDRRPDTVVTMIGGVDQAVGAFDAESGKLAWKSRTSKDAGYAPLNLMSYGGAEQLLLFSPAEVAGLDPANGEAFWSVEVEPDYGMSINSPRRAGNRLLLTSYGKTLSLVLGEDSPTATVDWRDPGPRSLFTANSRPFVDEGLAYGCDINSGLMRAIRLEDGKTAWESKEPVAPKGHDRRWRVRHATAFITKIVGEDRFVLFNDLGEIVFCTLDPKGYVETGRAKVIEPTGEAFGRKVVWSHPAYGDRAAFVRNDEKLVRVNLAK